MWVEAVSGCVHVRHVYMHPCVSVLISQSAMSVCLSVHWCARAPFNNVSLLTPPLSSHCHTHWLILHTCQQHNVENILAGQRTL